MSLELSTRPIVKDNVMELLLVLLVFGAAVWYLFRRFRRSISSDNPSCACGGCDGCPAQGNLHKDRDRPDADQR